MRVTVIEVVDKLVLEDVLEPDAGRHNGGGLVETEAYLLLLAEPLVDWCPVERDILFSHIEPLQVEWLLPVNVPERIEPFLHGRFAETLGQFCDHRVLLSIEPSGHASP